MSEPVDFRPVALEREKCKGCINCMKRCPTEAIRIREGRALVLYDKCIGCGECIRICTHRAKRAVYDEFDSLEKFTYKVALPPPSLYGQFNNLDDIDYVLNGLKAIGFDDVFEVSRAAELVSLATRNLMEEGGKRPAISSACPAVTELIWLRFNGLRDNILPVLSPVEVAAKLARERAKKQTGLPDDKIGVFFISPCPAKNFALKRHVTTRKRLVDGVLAASDVYFRLVSAMKKLEHLEPIKHSGIIGIGWASIGGEAAGVLKEKNLSADGVENCISVLRELENDTLKDIDFVELNACPSGCVGGVLNIENAFVAKSKIASIRKYLPVSLNKLEDYGKPLSYYLWDCEPKDNEVLKISDDPGTALRKIAEIEATLSALPLLDCGACGAPSCRAFAEDVALYGVDPGRCTRSGEEGNGTTESDK